MYGLHVRCIHVGTRGTTSHLQAGQTLAPPGLNA